MIAVAHPDLFVTIVKPAVQQIKRAIWRHIGPPELGRATAARDFTTFDASAKFLHHDLLAIANAKDRDTIVENTLGWARRAVSYNRIWTSRKDHSLRCQSVHKVHRDILIGVDLAIDVELAEASRNQLRHLAAKVDNKKAVMGDICHAHLLRKHECPCKRANVVLGTDATPLTSVPDCQRLKKQFIG